MSKEKVSFSTDELYLDGKVDLLKDVQVNVDESKNMIDISIKMDINNVNRFMYKGFNCKGSISKVTLSSAFKDYFDSIKEKKNNPNIISTDWSKYY